MRADHTAAPTDPLLTLRSLPNVVCVSFAEMACCVGSDRDKVISTFSASDDAITFTHVIDDDRKYIVVYNQRLDEQRLRFALARELGHIMLGHDGSRPETVREEQAIAFAKEFLK